MSPTHTFMITVIERTRHTLSVEADSPEAAAALLNDPQNPRITSVDTATLDLHIAEIRDSSGDYAHQGKEFER